jgi:hypothetical protein
VRDVGYPGQQLAKCAFELRYLLVEPRDALSDLAHFSLLFGGILSGFLKSRDLQAGGVPRGFQLFGLRDGRAAAGIELLKISQVGNGPARG